MSIEREKNVVTSEANKTPIDAEILSAVLMLQERPHGASLYRTTTFGVKTRILIDTIDPGAVRPVADIVTLSSGTTENIVTDVSGRLWKLHKNTDGAAVVKSMAGNTCRSHLRRAKVVCGTRAEILTKHGAALHDIMGFEKNLDEEILLTEQNMIRIGDKWATHCGEPVYVVTRSNTKDNVVVKLLSRHPTTHNKDVTLWRGDQFHEMLHAHPKLSPKRKIVVHEPDALTYDPQAERMRSLIIDSLICTIGENRAALNAHSVALRRAVISGVMRAVIDKIIPGLAASAHEHIALLAAVRQAVEDKT